MTTYEEKKAYQRAYYHAHKERAREYQREYNRTHRKLIKRGVTAKERALAAKFHGKGRNFHISDIQQASPERAAAIINAALRGEAVLVGLR